MNTNQLYGTTDATTAMMLLEVYHDWLADKEKYNAQLMGILPENETPEILTYYAHSALGGNSEMREQVGEFCAKYSALV